MGLSNKEIQLFSFFGISKGLMRVLDPVTLYNSMALDLFVENRTGPEVDSVRRCLKAIWDCDPYRNTPEFEALIQLQEEPQENLTNS